MRARVRAAGSAGLPVAALSGVDGRGSGLVVAALLLLESSGGAAGLAGCAASSDGRVQGACGESTTGWRIGVRAGAETEAFGSRARPAGKVGGLAVFSPARASAPAGQVDSGTRAGKSA